MFPPESPGPKEGPSCGRPVCLDDAERETQVAAVSAHLERARVLIERERDEPLMLCNDNLGDVDWR